MNFFARRGSWQERHKTICQRRAAPHGPSTVRRDGPCPAPPSPEWQRCEKCRPGRSRRVPCSRFVGEIKFGCRGGMYAARGRFCYPEGSGPRQTPALQSVREEAANRETSGGGRFCGRHTCRPYDRPFCPSQTGSEWRPQGPAGGVKTPPYARGHGDHAPKPGAGGGWGGSRRNRPPVLRPGRGNKPGNAPQTQTPPPIRAGVL